MVKCFLIEPSGKLQRSLRRYRGAVACPGGASYCNAMNVLEIVPDVRDASDAIPLQPAVCHSHPLWPTHCPLCKRAFTEEDNWQVFGDPIFRRVDTGEEFTLRDAPPGAMWFCKWHEDFGVGPDGKALMVRLPNGHDWHVDGVANNCTRREDKVHKCWVREGTVPVITVGKNGNTCSAGAGSILSGTYHGFLRNGMLVSC